MISQTRLYYVQVGIHASTEKKILEKYRLISFFLRRKKTDIEVWLMYCNCLQSPASQYRIPYCYSIAFFFSKMNAYADFFKPFY